MRPCHHGRAVFALVSLLILTAACSSLSRRSAQEVQDGVATAVEQIQLGMSRAEVLSLMGEPHMKRRVYLETSFEVWDYRSEDLARHQGILKGPPWVWFDPRYYFLKENMRYEGLVTVTFVRGRVVHVSPI